MRAAIAIARHAGLFAHVARWTTHAVDLRATSLGVGFGLKLHRERRILSVRGTTGLAQVRVSKCTSSTTIAMDWYWALHIQTEMTVLVHVSTLEDHTPMEITTCVSSIRSRVLSVRALVHVASVGAHSLCQLSGIASGSSSSANVLFGCSGDPSGSLSVP
eukprot:COSAG01_NODE_24372_length_781_cov_1.563050_1_plen_159_part_10